MSVMGDAASHVHHWVIETPNGPVVRGECRGCGAEREFVTAGVDGDSWNGAGAEAMAAARQRAARLRWKAARR